MAPPPYFTTIVLAYLCVICINIHKVYAVAPVPAPLSGLAGRDFLTVGDLTAEELLALLRLAAFLKRQPMREQRHLLRERIVALLFEKPSLRTRVSFEVATAKLGGETLFAQGSEFAVGSRETPEDAARVLSGYVDAIVVRTHDHAPLARFARAASVPVINGLSAEAHPCQALADMLTLAEHFGDVRGLCIAYLGDARNNVAASFAEAAVMLGATVHFGCPNTHRPSEAFLTGLARLASGTGGGARAFANPVRAVRGADALYTDVWTSMGEEQYRERNDAMLQSYAVTPELMSYAAAHAIFLHCLPAHRGEEVSAEVIDGPQSAVFVQAENRMHAQKALLVALLTHCKGYPI
jgi:ornithine carbamoyltransferase